MTNTNISKFCPHCKTVKTTDLFFKNCSRKDGLHSYCKVCINETNKVTAQRRKERGGEKMPPKVFVLCSKGDCLNQAVCKGLCTNHYERFRKHGDSFIAKRHNGEGNTPEQKFWSRLKLTANIEKCWEWKGSLAGNGYGIVYFGGKKSSVHRLAWFFTHGKFSEKLILHSCDNRKCGNPNHLREGTNAENSQDMVDRNRQQKGEQRFNSVLKESDVVVIRKLLSEKLLTQKEIASRFGVCAGTISQIKSNKNWKHIVLGGALLP